MSFTIDSRIKLYKRFYKIFNEKLKKNKDDNLFNIFKKTKKEIAYGIEGTVYKAPLDDDHDISIKLIDFQRLVIKKNANIDFLNKTPDDIYEIFNTLKKNTTYPSLVEIISFTLTNQLVFQKISPHFVLNYYWEYNDKKFIYYNEYINNGTLQEWAKQSQTEEVWINILLQIIFAIISMKRYFNMTHCDLSIANILIQQIPKGGAWKYIINKKEYILPNIGWICLINDFGFTTIPDKLYVDWYYTNDLKNIPEKQFEFLDFNKFANELLISKVFDNFKYSKNILTNSISLLYNNNIDILNVTYELHMWYFQQKNKNEIKIIDIYDMDKHLNKKLLPQNMFDFSTY